MVELAGQRRHGPSVGDVAVGDADIAKQPDASRPPHRTLTESSSERRLVEGQQVLEPGPRLDGRTESRQRVRVGRRRPSIDRADLLAQIATEDPVADQGPDGEWDDTAVFDGPEGNAAAIVEDAGRDQGSGGTHAPAGVASPAVPLH